MLIGSFKAFKDTKSARRGAYQIEMSTLQRTVKNFALNSEFIFKNAVPTTTSYMIKPRMC